MNPERLKRNPELRIRDQDFRRNLGVVLRGARQELQLSLRDLETRSGVSDSEIYQIEMGAQECRLESFLLIAEALGWPAGHLLDLAQLRCILPTFTKEVSSDPAFGALAADFGLTKLADRSFLRSILAAWCRAVAMLVRSSSVRRTIEAYKNFNIRAVEEPFRKLVEHLDKSDDPLSRLELLDGLSARPVVELRRQGFLSDKVLSELGAAFASPATMRAALGTPDNVLTGVTPEGNSEGVTKTLDALIERLKAACSVEGKRSELASFLQVPLPRISEWLAGVKKPGGETTLRMVQWVTEEEARFPARIATQPPAVKAARRVRSPKKPHTK